MSLEGRKYLLVFGFAFLWMILTVMALNAAGITSKLIEWTLFFADMASANWPRDM